MDMQISNENIIYIYLKTKNEVINLDQKMKQVEIFIEERAKQIEEQFKTGNLAPEFRMIQTLAKLSGQEFGLNEIRKMDEERMAAFREKVQKDYDLAMKTKLSILDELEVAFSVLRDEMPEIVEKYTTHIMSKDGPGAE